MHYGLMHGMLHHARIRVGHIRPLHAPIPVTPVGVDIHVPVGKLGPRLAGLIQLRAQALTSQTCTTGTTGVVDAVLGTELCCAASRRLQAAFVPGIKRS